MKKARGFKEGDKVFAKVKGYPAWPATVLQKKGKKYSVHFYGTGETGSVKQEELFYFLKHRDSLIKGSKKKEFQDALEEIEKAIAQAGGTDGDEDGSDDEATSGTKRKRRISETSTSSQPSKKPGRSSSPNSDRVSVSSENVSNAEMPNAEEVVTKKEVEEGNEEEYGTEVKTNNVLDDDLPPGSSIKLVSERTLKYWIIYGDYVKEAPQLYNARPADAREYFVTQTFPVMLPSKKYVGLKLHKTWPIPAFSNEFDNALFDVDIAERLLTLKPKVESGEVTPTNDPDSFMPNFNLTDAEIKRDFEMKIINTKYKHVERLRSEAKVFGLDVKLKSCLKVAKADTDQAIEYLHGLLEFDNYDEILLKKHSHVVEMVRRLRKYIGNTESWNLNPDELETFNKNAKKIRELADQLYQRFKGVVKLPPNTYNFWEGFNALVTKFKEDCRGMSNREVFTLSTEPWTRQAILERLEQRDDLEDHSPAAEDIEEENSSEAANTENNATLEPEA